MSEPARLENGYLRLANELAEAIARYPWGSGAECRVVMAVMRLTYGYNRSSAAIGLGRFARVTGLNQRTVERALERLAGRGVLVKIARRTDSGSARATVWKLNKRPGEWTWPEAGGEPAPRRSSRYPKDRPAEPEKDAPTMSNEPGPEMDPLTAQLMAEGFSGRELMTEHQRRRRQGPDSQTGASEERPGSATGAQGQRPDSRTDPPTECPDSRTDPSASRARARDAPSARPDQCPDSQTGGLKTFVNTKDLSARVREPGPPSPPGETRSPDGPAGPVGGAGQTHSSQAKTPGGTSPPDRQPDRGPRHIGELVAGIDHQLCLEGKG